MTGSAVRRGLVGVAALLVVGILAAGGVIVWVVANPVPAGSSSWPDKRVTEAVQAARDCVVTMHSLSYKNVDASLRAWTDCATGDFRKEVERLRAQAREAVVSRRIENRCVVHLTAVSELADGHIDVLLAVDAVQTPVGGSPQTRRYRVDARTVEVDGRWLIARLRYVG